MEKSFEMQFDEKDLFQQVTKRICGSLDIEKGLTDCFYYLKEYIPMDALTMFWLKSRHGTIRIIADKDNTSGLIKDTVIKIPDHCIKHLEKVRLINGAHVYNDFQEDEAVRTLSELSGKAGRSGIAMTLTIDGNPLGRIVASSNQKNIYSPNHARIMTFLHDPFAIALANYKKHQKIVQLKEALDDDKHFLMQKLQKLEGDEVIGADFGLKKVMDLVRQVAARDIPVMLLGETGVGKEVIANSIHYSSGRNRGPFIKVNCGAIPSALIDSELFGHEKGSFTGALDQKLGRFERANGGTIFLDEIGELPHTIQVRLLRVIQFHELERVGGTKKVPLDIRIISATNRDMAALVKNGDFREDLFFRLHAFPIHIPPLRHRKVDIPALVNHFLSEKCRELNITPIPTVSPGLLDQLMNYSWKGNVRELENVIERALIRYNGYELTLDSAFSTSERSGNTAASGNLKQELYLDHVITKHIEAALDATQGKVNGSDGAAKLLNIHPNTLRNKMNKLGIPYGQNRPVK